VEVSPNINATKSVVDIVIPVYNDNPYLEETLRSIVDQVLPAHWSFHIYVVDDGSDESINLTVESDEISVIRLDVNSGCSVARNRGAQAGSGELVLFLDADCSFAHNKVLALLVEQCSAGFDVCFGQIHVIGNGFWAAYQNKVAIERSIRFSQGDKSSMTTAIFMVARSVYESIGGFDEGYDFGFEDRDLFISLINAGAKVSLVEEAIVNHNDDISLMSVCNKLYKSGATSSVLFIKKHPDEYTKMAYAKADVKYCKNDLGLLVLASKPMLWPLVSMVDWALRKNLLPFFLAKNLVKYLSGLAYLHGTAARS